MQVIAKTAIVTNNEMNKSSYFIFVEPELAPSYTKDLLLLIDHFIVVCLVTWLLNESEAGVDLVLIETSLLFICKFLLISMRTASLT